MTLVPVIGVSVTKWLILGSIIRPIRLKSPQEPNILTAELCRSDTYPYPEEGLLRHGYKSSIPMNRITLYGIVVQEIRRAWELPCNAHHEPHF